MITYSTVLDDDYVKCYGNDHALLCTYCTYGQTLSLTSNTHVLRFNQG